MNYFSRMGKILAYGFKRQQKDFEGVENDLLVLEDDRKRTGLVEAINDFLRGGHDDVVRILDPKDIPERGPFREAIEAKGATIEVFARKPVKLGRKSKIDTVTPEDFKAAKAIWDKPYYEVHAAEMIGEVLGFQVDRFFCRRHFGERGFRKKGKDG